MFLRINLFWILIAVELFPQLENLQLNVPSSATTINVTIGGDFIVNGTFKAALNERVDQFVSRTYNESYQTTLRSFTDKELIKELERRKNLYPLRNIKLKKITGEEFIIDLAKFRLNGDFKNNPYLSNDDIIIFPPYDSERGIFSIYGAVNKPGSYQYVKGDRFSDALELAMGLNLAFESPTTFELLRLSYDGKEITKKIYNISDNPELLPGDRIRVISGPSEKRDYKVMILGEVNNPGIVPITKNSTSIMDAINMAGGFTNDASLVDVRVFNKNSFPPEFFTSQFNVNVGANYWDPDVQTKLFELLDRIEQLRFLRMSNLTEKDTSYFLLETELRSLLNGPSLDLSKGQDSEIGKNYILFDEQIVVVQRKKEFVEVMGQVLNPGLIPYKEGATFEYYLNICGGMGEYAIYDDIKVIKNHSRQWVSPIDKKIEIMPGDIIFIPREPAYSFDYYVWRFSSYVSIVGSIATIILLLLQFTK